MALFGSSSRGGAGGGSAACLLLVPRGYDAPADLLDGFRQRGVAINEAADAPAVMVSLSRRSYVALVIVEPAAIADAHSLARAVGRYYAGLPVWRYSKSGEPRLGPFKAGDNGNPAVAQQTISNDALHGTSSHNSGGGNGAAPLPAASEMGASSSAVEAELKLDEQLESGRGGAIRMTGPASGPSNTQNLKPVSPSDPAPNSKKPDTNEGPLLADLTDEELALLLTPDEQEEGL